MNVSGLKVPKSNPFKLLCMPLLPATFGDDSINKEQHFSINVKFLSFQTPKKLCGNQPKIQIKRTKLRVLRQKDAIGIANSDDPDQTAPLGDLSVRKLRVIPVLFHYTLTGNENATV